jgi:hypothetical protein
VKSFSYLGSLDEEAIYSNFKPLICKPDLIPFPMASDEFCYQLYISLKKRGLNEKGP